MHRRTRGTAPDTPATTNFLVLRTIDALDYWRWAPELDILSNDHYLMSDDPEAEIDIAPNGDLMRSLAGGPWFLMEHSTGAAWYLATHPDQDTLAALLDRIRQEAGVTPEQDAPAGMEVVRRRGAEADYLFLIDHTGKGAEAPAEGVELLTGAPVTGTVTVPPGGVAVIREPR
ncbi:beta-galactosidase [Streptomyces sp. NPDC002888]|uniref:beta-galactosidase n=1 Tax=Streptomyces sp. NPDC002888 TaxID=3364668 RepID=UPI00368C73C2